MRAPFMAGVLLLALSIDLPCADLVLRKVAEVGLTGQVSPDGKFLSYMDSETGGLGLLNLLTLERRVLTASYWPEFVQGSSFSNDSRKIVYGWVARGGIRQLRVMRLAGGEPEVLYDAPDSILAGPWSPDGRLVSALLSVDGDYKPVLVSTDDHSVRTIDGVSDTVRLFSPDSRFLIYNAPSSEPDAGRNVTAFDLERKETIHLTETASDDIALGWTPDRKFLAFLSDRGGTTGAWVVEVSDEQPAGAPLRLPLQSIEHSPASIRSLGCSTAGSCFFGFNTYTNDVYVADLHLDEGRIEEPQRVVQQVGFDTSPEWSSSGDSLAYVYGGRGRMDLALYSVADRVESRRPLALERFGSHAAQPLWSQDDRQILIQSWDLYTLDPENLEASVAAERGRHGADRSGVEWPSWLDEDRIVFVRYGPRRIVVRDLSDGRENVLYQPQQQTGSVSHLRASPDGRWVAFLGRNAGVVLKVVSAETRAVRDLVVLPEPLELPMDSRSSLWIGSLIPADLYIPPRQQGRILSSSGESEFREGSPSS